MIGVSIGRTTWPVIAMPESAIAIVSDVTSAPSKVGAELRGGAASEHHVEERSAVGDGEAGARRDEALGDPERRCRPGWPGRHHECVDRLVAAPA